MSTNANALKKSKSRVNTRMLTQVAILSAISAILMLFEIPLGFAPPFYKIDLSEIPVMIGCFAMGPVAGAAIELVKVILNLALNGTVTAGVGEFANLLIGCSLVVPAGLIYRRKNSKAGALGGMICGTLFMTLVGAFLNAYLLLPTYAKAFGMPIDALIEMGTAVNGNITSLWSFIFLAVVPFNLLKGVVVTVITLLIYKKISTLLKGRNN